MIYEIQDAGGDILSFTSEKEIAEANVPVGGNVVEHPEW